MTTAKFSNFNIASELAKKLPYLATPVQRKTIPKILDGANTTSIARTGSGKTLAYLVPIIQKCMEDNTPSVIIVPTRELVMQVNKMLRDITKCKDGSKKKYANDKIDGNSDINVCKDEVETSNAYKDTIKSDATNMQYTIKSDTSTAGNTKINQLKAIQIYGGTSIYKDFESLSKPFNILIATVGRLRHCLDEVKKSYSFNILCVDEMDRIFDDATMQSDLLYILEKIKYKQKVFFSATLPEKLISLITDTDIIKIDNEISKTLTSMFFYTRNELKEKALIYMLNMYKNKKILVFAGTRHTVEYLSEILTNTRKIYSSMDQQAREESLSAFTRQKVAKDDNDDAVYNTDKNISINHTDKNNSIKQNNSNKPVVNVLLVTDLACRGLDIKDLDIIINYDLCDEKTFLHRIGRVARNGREGTSISLVSYNDIYLFYNIQENYYKDIEIGEIPTHLLDNIHVKQSNLKVVSERGNVKMEKYRKAIKGIQVTKKVSEFEVHSMFKADSNKEAFLKDIKNYKNNSQNVNLSSNLNNEKNNDTNKNNDTVKNTDTNKIIDTNKNNDTKKNINTKKTIDTKNTIDTNKTDYKDQFYIPYTNKENKSSLHYSAFSIPKDEKVKEREVKRKKIGEMYKSWEKMKRKNANKKSKC
ncbi:ATP-dependent RNA helicase dbp10 [Binucleata daphniae]